MDNPKLPLDFMIDVTKQTQSIIQERSQNTNNVEYKISNLPAEDYWVKRGVHQYYNKGTILGSGVRQDSDIEVFFRLFKKTIEEIIRTELTQTEKTSEAYKDDFKILEHTYNNLVTRLKKDQILTCNDRILSTLHGFINSFIGSSHG